MRPVPQYSNGEIVNMTSNPDYNAKYYQKRRQELLDNKRDKYASDPEYRLKMIERAKAFRKQKTNEGTLAFYKDGGRYLTYAGVAKKLSISVDTLKTWIRQEDIPSHDCEIQALPCFSPWLWRVILQTTKGQKHYGKTRRAANQAVQNAPEGTPKNGNPPHRKRRANRKRDLV
jgi:hypothetical protein